MKSTIKITLFIAFALFLFACGSKIDYQTGFPQETSPALTNFMTDYFMQRESFLFKTEENEYVFADRNGNYEDENIDYFSVYTGEMEKFYLPVQEDNEPSQALNTLYHQVEEIQQPIQDNLSLPTITFLDNNTLFIVSKENEREFSLPALEDSIQEDDQLILNLSRVNNEGFVMQIDKRSTKDTFS